MSKIYAVIGTSQQTIIADAVRYNPQANEVLMKSERPSEGEYVANENGEWVVPEPTIDEKLAELDAQYNAEVARLGNEFNSAQLRGDSEVMTALQEEMTSLDEWYDTEYNNIIGGDE